MKIGKFDLQQAFNTFWNSPRRNTLLLAYFGFFIITTLVSALSAGEDPGLTLLYLLMIVPTIIWQYAVLIRNTQISFQQEAAGDELIHPFELSKLRGLLRPTLGYIAANVLYIVPVFVLLMPLFFVSELLDSNIFAQLFTFSIFVLLLIYVLFVTIFVQPAILILGVRSGFAMTLNPNNILRFIRQNHNDLLFLLLNQILLGVLMLIVGVLVLLSIYICIGIVLLPIYVAIFTAYQFVILPLLYAQAWGEKN